MGSKGVWITDVIVKNDKRKDEAFTIITSWLFSEGDKLTVLTTVNDKMNEAEIEPLFYTRGVIESLTAELYAAANVTGRSLTMDEGLSIHLAAIKAVQGAFLK